MIGGFAKPGIMSRSRPVRQPADETGAPNSQDEDFNFTHRAKRFPPSQCFFWSRSFRAKRSDNAEI
ncbi:hypothetical protein BH23BAC3_BH23BAC3_22620 [soil metagenome]